MPAHSSRFDVAILDTDAEIRAIEGEWLSLVEGGSDTPPFAYKVTRNAQQPADRMDVEYWLHYDGVARQIYVQQSIV